MHKFKIYLDAVLNILLPLLMGILIYASKPYFSLPKIVANYLADGLWAYAFMSAILIIWHRKINIFWIVTCFAIAILFELLQYNNIIAGVGDIYDVLCYLVFYIFALLLNIYLKKNYD